MHPTLKTPGKIFLGLLLAGWLCVVLFRKPPAATVSVVTASIDNAEPALSSAPVDLEAPGEDAWAKELRELKEWAVKEPDAALARVARMSEKHERKIAAKAVCLELASKDPAKAMTAAWNFELGVFADEMAESEALETLARQWAAADLGKAFLWASTLPADDESRRDRVVKGIALALAQIAPAEAARMVAERISPDSSVKMDAMIEVLRQWAAQEYGGAIAWAALFPEGALRERGIEALANIDPAGRSSPKRPD